MFEPLNEIKREREIGTEISQPHDDPALLCHLKRKEGGAVFCAGRAAGDFDVLRAGGPTWTARQRPDGEGRGRLRGGVGNDDNGEPGGPHVGLLPGAGDVDDGVGAVAGRGGGRPVGAVRLRRRGGGVGLGGAAGNARRRGRRRRLRARAGELPRRAIFRVRRVGSEFGHAEPERERGDHGGTPLPLPGVVQRGGGGGAAAAVPRGAAAAVGQVGGGDPGPAQGGARLARHLRDGRGRGARIRRRRAALPRQPRQAQLPRGRAPAPGHRRPRRRAGPCADRRGVGLDARHVRRRRAGLGLPALPDAAAGQGRRRQPGQPSLVLRRGRRRRHVQLVWRRHEQLLWRRRHHERFLGLLLLVPVLLRLGGHRAVLLLRLLCAGPLLLVAARLAAAPAAGRRGGGVELGERPGALPGDDDGGLLVRLEPAAVPPAAHPIAQQSRSRSQPRFCAVSGRKNKLCTDGDGDGRSKQKIENDGVMASLTEGHVLIDSCGRAHFVRSLISLGGGAGSPVFSTFCFGYYCKLSEEMEVWILQGRFNRCLLGSFNPVIWEKIMLLPGFVVWPLQSMAWISNSGRFLLKKPLNSIQCSNKKISYYYTDAIHSTAGRWKETVSCSALMPIILHLCVMPLFSFR